MNPYSRTTLSYLRRHYFDNEKLKKLAFSEFVSAVRSGRLIAFTGSLTTAHCGYPTWSGLFSQAREYIQNGLKDSHPDSGQEKDFNDVLESFKVIAESSFKFDSRVAYSVGAQMLDDVDTTKKLSANVGVQIANDFKARNPCSEFIGLDESKTPIAALLDDLKIKRIVTTNYDLELEYRAMELVNLDDETTPNPWGSIENRIKNGEFEKTGTKAEEYSLVHTLPNGDRIASDIMMRNQPKNLLEFAIGSTSYHTHIFHIHGRADVPQEMIVSYRDYDRLYRRDGLGKAPFEHGLRALLAGNPVIFTGLGMSEPELNTTLEEFVGNNPFLRKAPAFLIWSPPPEEDRVGMTDQQWKTTFRLDKLHRLGILTIFSDEIRNNDGNLYLEYAPNNTTQAKSVNLQRSLASLSKYAVDQQVKRIEDVPPDRWRNSYERIRKGFQRSSDQDTGSIVDTWTIVWNDPKVPPKSSRPTLKFAKGEVIKVHVQTNGTSKTNLASYLAKKWKRKSANHLSIVINFNMRIDTDSILDLLALAFRFNPRTHQNYEDTNARKSREDQFEEIDYHAADGREVLIVLKGIERIFDVNGNPLSAEFDQFLRTIIGRYNQHKIKIIVLGSGRILPYFKTWKDCLRREFGKECKVIDCDTVSKEHPVKSSYLEGLHDKFAEMETGIPGTALKNKRSGDYATFRRRAFAIIINRRALGKADRVSDPDLALEILTLMSFVGQPLEPAVLFHAPKIRKRLALDNRKTTIDDVKKASEYLLRCIEQLENLNLVKEVNVRLGKPEYDKRFAIHLSLQAEMRDRNAIPLSDSILSTAYNMSLYCAQPADAALPEAELHDDLGQLVDWLVGAYKDEPYRYNCEFSPSKNDKSQPHVVSALRAAFAIIRGLYSTSALLSLDRGDRESHNDREGALSEHAERLDRIINASENIWRKRASLSSGEITHGPEALYPDELVWLHNERGVVKLAQGDLYEARFSFDEAERINIAYVEFLSKSHNWRRISINQLLVDIERGKLQSADDRMNNIEEALGVEKTEYIRKNYLNCESPVRIRFDVKVSHEDILVMALITGYRGLTAHLRGELDQARQHFERSINVLQRMDEQRALALFRRHFASLLNDIGDEKGTRKESRYATANAESGRQLDVAYAARLVEACAAETSGSASDLRHGLELANTALEYATLTDMHRLTIEAQARLARANLTSGDLDSAMEHASEAIAVATRYGMSLHKVSLRTLMGQILIKRGSTKSGQSMINNAIREAVRIGYQRAVEGAHRAQSNI